ncbi:pseudouridine synthase [Lacihabitans sp. CS3-21]|jgi:23S rRNA pseudouridine2457 synthase|uniref:pseudouridine synthase n=1 Tax=Lacihabitans sp. CS3-21 TaxID=2487332 RepID=UPI0020CCDB97|nr:pseudouridine synthase [Lacihabitans sp. CS3-21]MCP9746209.1 rRNA pseudouridine synthase [Lacihabitans sp. CS3-21]
MEVLEHRYFILNKPYNMLSQFIGDNFGNNMLGKIDFDFPKGTHAIGRLDNLSEGLLILTTNKKVTKLLFNSKILHKRTYLVQVDATITDQDISDLKSGVPILLRGNIMWTTSPCDVERIEKPDECYNIVNTLHPRHPHAWLKITLTEGKYRQIRKMIIAVNNKCKRLIRTSIEDLELGNLPVGQIREYSESAFFQMLKIEY